MKEDLTTYDIKPEDFLNYLRYYGEHFNKKLCEFAIRLLPKRDYTLEKVEQLCKLYNIELKNNKLYDSVYLANWAKSIFYGSSLSDEKRLIMFVRDILDKEDDLVFNRWYADCAKRGIPVDWELMI